LPSADIGVAGGGDTALNYLLRGGRYRMRLNVQTLTKSSARKVTVYIQAGGLKLDSQLG
jgi:hypothetical protein